VLAVSAVAVAAIPLSHNAQAVATEVARRMEAGETAVSPAVVPYIQTAKTSEGYAGNPACNACFDVAYEVAWGLLPVIGDSLTFLGCCKTCNPQDPTACDHFPCVMGCMAIEGQNFTNWMIKEDIDVISICQNLNYCPVGDCNGNCAEITSFTVEPQFDVSPAPFTFTVNWNSYQNWTGTGMVYIQVSAYGNMSTGDLIDNDGRLIQWPVPIPNPPPIVFILTCDDGWDAEDNNYIADVLLCEGQCEFYGPSRHPHTRVFAQAQVAFQCENTSRNQKGGIQIQMPA